MLETKKKIQDLSSSRRYSLAFSPPKGDQSLESFPRASRYLGSVNLVNIGLSILILVGIEVVLIVYLKDIGQLFSHLTMQLASYAGLTVELGQDFFYGTPIFPLEVLPPARDSHMLWVWGTGGILGILVLLRYHLFAIPLRIVLVSNLAIVVISASYLLATGDVGYSVIDFSHLYLRTTLGRWLMIPCVMGGLSLMFPFSLVERIGMIILALLYSFIFASVRYVVFMWILTRSDAILIPNIYFFVELPLDYICLTGFFSSFLLHRIRKLWQREK